MLDAAVVVEHLAAERGGRRVLRRLSFPVQAGTVTGLLGPSGCGKTTLMRCMVGVQQTKHGGVTVLGEPAGSPALRGRVGYVTQSPSVYADLSVRDNLRYFAVLAGVPRARRGARTEQVLEQVGLVEHAADRVGALSGGERARASLACALVGDPVLLVLDEPTVGLDPLLRRDLWALFHTLADQGNTLVVSSHVMDEAARCDRLLLLRDGQLVADDTPDAIRSRTGTPDLEESFVRLAERQGVAA